MYENRPEFVPISKKLIQMATLAHKSYQGYLENEGAKKRICEEEHLRDQLKSIQTSVEVVVTESKSLEALENELKTRESNVLQQNKAACSILQQASERLDSAIEKGDLVEVRVAKGLLEGYQQIKNMETKDAAETKKSSLNKRKSALINSFIKKRKKEFLFIFC
jgi:DNA repair exonuclease SbcCD ATPase subunit